MKRIYKIIFCTFLVFNAFAQEKKEKFGEKIVVGTNVFYFPDDNNTKWQYYYQEILWNKNIAFSLNKHWFLGINHFDIWAKGAWKNERPNFKEKYNIFGVFAQYSHIIGRENSVIRKNTEFFFENSFHYGNLCSCGSELAYKKSGLLYWGLGGGVDIRITNYLSFEVGFHNYQIISKAYHKYNSTQMILGLNYKWFRK